MHCSTVVLDSFHLLTFPPEETTTSTDSVPPRFLVVDGGEAIAVNFNFDLDAMSNSTGRAHSIS